MIDLSAAKQDYVCDKSLSYKKLAEKYGAPLSLISRVARREEWVKKREEHMQNGFASVSESVDKLHLLKRASDKAIEALYSKLCDYCDLSINDLKNLSAILKTLTGVQRDLNNLPTFKEENSILLSKERLQLVRARISSDDGEDSETGVVFIPFLDEEEEGEAFVTEGEDDV